MSEEENRRVAAARRKAWNDWVAASWIKSPGKVYAWCKTERPAPIFSTTDAQGNWVLDPNDVAQEAARQWGRLWKPCPPRKSPRPSHSPICPACPPSRVASCGTWSGTSFEPRPRDWTLGRQMT